MARSQACYAGARRRYGHGKIALEEIALAANLKTALVTGAGSGIGRSIAKTLAEMGLRVALVGRERDKLERARAEFKVGRDSAFVGPCDITDRVAVKSLVDQITAAVGAIDVLVCNAGTNVRNRSLESLDPADWDRMIATNLTGSFNLIHHFLPSMRQRKDGLVIQICSVSGLRASTLGGAGYSASKFGQSALGICLGREEGPHGIRSSVIYPGEVETPILDARPVPVGAERRSVILQPDDVAAAVKFLVELHPRAHVPELVIMPTIDDYC
jgi:NADP-dependent 3-hydroxy acid dehydrogenase YdfG